MADFKTWALNQVRDNSAGNTEMVEASVQRLLDSLVALRGIRPTQVFGMAPGKFALDERAEIAQAALDALVGWRDHFKATGDNVSLHAIHEAAEVFELDELKETERAQLMCDPLGTRDGVTAEWAGRLQKLDALQPDGDAVRLGAPNASSLYAFALRFEGMTSTAFSRDVAAFLATADGLSLDGDGTLKAVADWSWREEGLVLGCGRYDPDGVAILQGTQSSPALFDGKVVERDEDGVELTSYASLGAFVDALLHDAQMALL